MKKILYIITFILLTGCTSRIFIKHGISTNNIGDGGFISKNPCGPPCFFGITPGITTDKDISYLLNVLPDVITNCKEYDFTSEGGKNGLICDYINITYRNNIVDVIGFSLSKNITIQQVIDSYGNPDLVDIDIISLPDKPYTTGMILYFDRIQTILQPPDQKGRKFTIDKDTRIIRIVYLTNNEYLETRGIEGHIPWRGYGTYYSYLR